ncbi:hypothetical protein [Mycolicibacterium conceptionense]|uniref:hypothetical protein n=1 Tax=Mycolicibacterium conceptionense TaxID=451644 RepID=UPI0013F64AB6|nr:hypothetical protein [Mycolicibacterium conceptionense]
MDKHTREALKRIRVNRPTGVAGVLARIGDAFHKAALAVDRETMLGLYVSIFC